MTHSPALTRVMVCGVFAIAAAPIARPPIRQSSRPAGLSYTSTVVLVAPLAAGSPGADTMVSDEQYSGDNGRSDVRRWDNRILHNTDSTRRRLGIEPGLYHLYRRGSETVTVVDTVRRQYFAYDRDSAMRASGVTQRVPHTGDTVFAIRVQPDTVIDGRRAEHWRRTNVVTTRSPHSAAITLHSIDDIYVATTLKEMDFAIANSWGSPSILTGTAYSRDVKATDAKMPHGLRVLIVRRTAFDSAANSPERLAIVYTIRLSNIRYGDIPNGVFAVPAGYQLVASPTLPAIRIPPSPRN